MLTPAAGRQRLSPGALTSSPISPDGYLLGVDCYALGWSRNVRGLLELFCMCACPLQLGRERYPCLDFLQEHTAALVSFSNRNVASPS